MEKNDNKESLDLLIKLSKAQFKCPNVNCCEYEKYNQCYNHAHALCIEFETYAVSKSDRRTPKDL